MIFMYYKIDVPGRCLVVYTRLKKEMAGCVEAFLPFPQTAVPLAGADKIWVLPRERRARRKGHGRACATKKTFAPNDTTAES